MKAITFFTSLLIPFAAFCQNEPEPFVLITMPKSGSHMIIKALHFLTGSEPVWHTRFPSYQYIPANRGFLYTHFCLSPELEADYQELPRLKKIILIRDLRDVAVSMVNQIKKAPWPGLTHDERQKFCAMSFSDQLHFVINFDYDVRAIAHRSPNSLQVSLVRIAEQSMRYAQMPDALILRYEDLVGPQGGGTHDAQIAQMQKIKNFLQLDFSEDFLCEIATQLYGDTINPFGQGAFQNFQSTFQFGRMNRWKEVFTDNHKVAFKEKLGNALITLGYEQDDIW